MDHEAIGALDAASRKAVGVARYVRDDEQPHIAEAALTVADAWQRRGLGDKLLRRLRDRATASGIRRFTALKLFGRLGEVTVTSRDGSVIEIAVEL